MSNQIIAVTWDRPLVVKILDKRMFLKLNDASPEKSYNIKIEVIKIVRTAAGCSLKTAYNFVQDAMEGDVYVTHGQLIVINAAMRAYASTIMPLLVSVNVPLYQRGYFDYTQLLNNETSKVNVMSQSLDGLPRRLYTRGQNAALTRLTRERRGR